MDPNELPSPLSKPGTQWTSEECFAVKTWFAKSFAKRAISAALLRLGSDPRLAKASFAEQAVVEWYEDRFDRMVQNFDPAQGAFLNFSLADLGKYVTSTFARKLRLQWDRERPEMQEDEEGNKTGQVFERVVGDDGRDRSERLDLLRQVANGLTEPDRQLLLMVAGGYSRDEIATRLGIAEGNARIQIFRARARARAILVELERGGADAKTTGVL